MALYSKEQHTHEIRISKNIEIVSFVWFSSGCLSSIALVSLYFFCKPQKLFHIRSNLIFCLQFVWFQFLLLKFRLEAAPCWFFNSTNHFLICHAFNHVCAFLQEENQGILEIDVTTTLTVLQNPRITSSQNGCSWKEPQWGHLVQPSCWSKFTQVWLHRIVTRQVSNITREGDMPVLCHPPSISQSRQHPLLFPHLPGLLCHIRISDWLSIFSSW